MNKTLYIFILLIAVSIGLFETKTLAQSPENTEQPRAETENLGKKEFEVN